MIKTLHFAVEVETKGLTRVDLTGAVQSVVYGMVSCERNIWSIADPRGRIWRVVADDAHPAAVHRGKIVSPRLDYSDLAELQRVVQTVLHAGGDVNLSRGIRVCLDDQSGQDAQR